MHAHAGRRHVTSPARRRVGGEPELEGRRGGATAAAAAVAERHNDCGALLAAHPTITRIGFIGARAKAAFDRCPAGLAPERGGVQLRVLPSSSRANTQPLASKAAEWRRLIMEGAPDE
jgi:G:T/U-mismatch repair DNA glycosylase